MNSHPDEQLAEIPRGTTEEAVPILLVDDQPMNLEALQAMLDKSGCRFVLARSADEALLALLDQEFAAIVLDIRMPGMSGLELAQLIKSRRRTQHVPILFLTAHLMDEQDELIGYRTGAVDYLTKPIKPEILRSKIAVFTDLFRKNRALAQMNDTLQGEIAERERMEDALREANQELERRVEDRTAALREGDRRKDEFLASLAHELRNPLAALHAASEVFRIKLPEGTNLDGPQGVFSRQLRHMTRMVDDLLDVSRITRDKLILQRSRVELAKVIAAAVETSRPMIEQRRHSFTVSVSPEPVLLDADLVRLGQVFSNLLDNAAKYTDPGGRIELATEIEGEQVNIRIGDSGIGIAPDVLPRIFDIFMQGERTPERSRGGLGIGLTLVRRLVELHGGTVQAFSEGNGRGSRFVVSLPIAARAAVAAETAGEGPAAVGQSLRILIVEDNRDAAEMLNELLESWGHETRMAFDGPAGVVAADEFRPQAILLDIGLPGMNGYDVARKLRERAWCRNVPIIAVTGWGQEADRQRSAEAGIDHHLLKPVEPAALRTLLAGFDLRTVIRSSRPETSRTRA